MPTDAELLQHYVEDRDEHAFAELVQRHLGLVYSAALRRTGGRHVLAEEISQKIFSDLARKAAALTAHPALSGWLYRSTRYAVIDTMRAEQRRQKLEGSFTAMHDEFVSPESPVDWGHLRPVLDDAMDQLKERDREIILLRFFNGASFAEVGDRLNLTENAARMRTERALDKLRVHLGRRGVTSTTAALGLLLSTPSFAAAPAGLAATVTAAAITTTPAGGAVGIMSIFLMSKFATPTISAAIAAGLTAVAWTAVVHGVNAKELADLRQENARLSQATTSPAAVTSEFATIAQAVDRIHSKGANTTSTANTASVATAQPAVHPGGHRDHGQATPHDAMMSFAWAGDTLNIDALSKLIWFSDKDREGALAVLASMPESIRAQYPTPEKLYAFFFAADCLVGPPPGADVIERYNIVELSSGRVADRRPGSTKNMHEYQQTPDGWKYVVPPAAVKYAPKVLNNETLMKLITP